MARLNDSAAPVDPVELLRRKYSRQNKEIARVNSTQCVRIRNLENEVSRLLAENLGLHEQILRLRNEVDSRRAQKMAEQVAVTKSNLEAKLLELTALVTSLGDEPTPSGGLSAKELEILQAGATRSPDNRSWKNTCPLSEAAVLQDGRLPPILEDKLYPRLTLETTEVVNTLSYPVMDNTESPDIGPPPVSKFINEDPVKIDLLSQAGADTEEPTGIDPSQSVNLEQRRKRRDSTAPSERKRPSRFEPNPNQSAKEVVQNLKTGAKRKLSSRDEDDGVSGTKLIEAPPDDFTYTRRTVEDHLQGKPTEEIDKGGNYPPREFVDVRGMPHDRPSSSFSTNGRKVLAPKSTNTDIVKSPKKITNATLADNPSLEKRISLRRDRSGERGRERRHEYIASQFIVEPIAEAVDIKGEPERPADPDLLSPPVSGPSAAYAQSRDTPPPSDLGPGNDGHRPSRRTKGSVSYAEPNLRDKMRRPTKELVDAVTGERKAQRLSVVELEQDPVTTALKIKEEIEIDNPWKDIPTVSLSNMYPKSPLGNRAASSTSVHEIVPTQRQRRSSMHPSVDSGISGSTSGLATSSVLPVQLRKSPQEHDKESEQKNASLDEAMARLDIYEFTGSSSREGNGSKIPTCKTEEHVTKPTRQSSSAMHEPGQVMQAESSDGESDGRLLSTSSRRRQWITGLGASGPDTQADHPKVGHGMRRSNSHSTSSKGAERGSRSERVSARRRSMML